jgi:NAD(P)-dependent dehydrogenase (short-subunit alcohol dehydrogenase family)
MKKRLDGKVAVITGASSGIGAAAAIRFVNEGCRVVLGDIQVPQGQALASSLGSAATFSVCDVSTEEDVARLVDLAVSTFGRLDIMFNNAGIVGAKGPIQSTPAAEWLATLDILLNGVFYGVKHAARVMQPQGSGSIINMTSVAGIVGGLGPHAYTAAKHAVIGLTKSTCAELCSDGIRVNAIAPYTMATPMVASAHLQDHNAVEQTSMTLAGKSPLPDRAGTAEDVANAALWLASDESGYTSGLTLTTDAGVTSGSTMLNARRYGEYTPMQKEAGKTGL